MFKNKNHIVNKIYPELSNHFMNRYYERVLCKECPKKITHSIISYIKKDMMLKIKKNELVAMNFFSNTKNIKVPFSSFYTVVLKNNRLITIY